MRLSFVVSVYKYTNEDSDWAQVHSICVSSSSHPELGLFMSALGLKDGRQIRPRCVRSSDLLLESSIVGGLRSEMSKFKYRFLEAEQHSKNWAPRPVQRKDVELNHSGRIESQILPFLCEHVGDLMAGQVGSEIEMLLHSAGLTGQIEKMVQAMQPTSKDHPSFGTW